ncbi:uncharacterized protein BDR25DRAFT_212127 [Lindgomyces ingoldianus]|uniref:Uncharacterized protein n=1 Tax=Lindgomyces ingoldianus TaxID=673940 RepID=A0ACB6R9Q0_9PLEO|nr:uncharacterized protein BDR25DRAFT_212127 [Lindgomyces ingoldianus]KAF2476008.1 hypothetical protein BDR25DRAFT_212127 [Lindgomyces ingoldianus]
MQNLSTLPTSLLLHSTLLLSTGLWVGFIIPLTPFPRLALTAHIQFMVEGCMVGIIGLILNTTFQPTSTRKGGGNEGGKRLVDEMGKWKQALVYWSCVSVWMTVGSEFVNAWWGTREVLGIAAEQAGVLVKAEEWMETVIKITHFPSSIVMAFTVNLSFPNRPTLLQPHTYT